LRQLTISKSWRPLFATAQSFAQVCRHFAEKIPGPLACRRKWLNLPAHREMPMSPNEVIAKVKNLPAVS
jgi:hypothetical protein